MSFTKDELERIVKSSLKKLRKLDKKLLDINVNERTITHKLAEYLQQNFPEFNVDCEYNRFEDLVKRLEFPKDKINGEDTEAKSVFPDIIIHKRGIQENNLLVIEVKKSSNINPADFDQLKLHTFRQEPYGYTFGLFLRIDLDGENDKLEWVL
ncbi:hypothetical protein LCGC14_2250330 [marine sediment metagenome]|uniref:Type I restriction enzyme R protein N-terminal domain-containing protein n=1 Tax=marine sediment metagenome TaxID=412755 RepID=A0A0F9FFB1_9ZZZZ